MAKKITIKDIARESGYSIGTVSRTLNSMSGVSAEAREAIQQIVDKYHFQLNSNAKFLKQRARQGIVIMIRGLNNMLFADLIEKLQRMSEEMGYDPYIYYISEEEDEVEEAQKVCQLRSPKGIMFLGSSRENFRKRFSGITIPCLLVTNSALGLPYPNLSSVTVNDAAAAQYVIEYLFSLGHENIGYVGGNLSWSQAAKSRYQGAQYAFYNRGKNFNYNENYEESDFSIEGGYESMKKLLEKNPSLTAVFFISDTMAIGGMRAIRDAGLRVPEDISVIGFDGIKMSRYTCPRLTTVKQDTDLIAKRSLELLTHTIEELSMPVNEEIPFTFVTGESVRSLNGMPVDFMMADQEAEKLNTDAEAELVLPELE